jgi:hypothetical protein
MYTFMYTIRKARGADRATGSPAREAVGDSVSL